MAGRAWGGGRAPAKARGGNVGAAGRMWAPPGGGKRRKISMHVSRIPGFFWGRPPLTPSSPLSILTLAAGIARDPDGRRRGQDMLRNPAQTLPRFFTSGVHLHEGATMSSYPSGNGAKSRKKITTATIRARKGKGKITALTAYDYPTAQIADAAGVDVLLVGDSLGMVALGYSDTTKVTLEDMLHHTKAVSRAHPKALLVSDMPFLSFGVSREKTLRNAGRLIQEGGTEAVKLEGGERVAEEIKALVDCQIPVMGHIGLTPQSVHQFGGFKIQGKSDAGAEQVLRDALAVQKGGAFSLVLEGIPASLGERITREVDIPTIGIGAGPECDGQILVTQDMLHFFQDFTPKFVKQYGNLGESARTAIERYCAEVREGIFPGKEHCF